MHFQSTDRGGPSGPSGPSGPTPPNTYNNSASLPYLERRHPQSSQPWFTAAADTAAADGGGGGGDSLWAWTGLLGPRSRRPAGMGGGGPPPTASLSLSDGGGGVTFRLGDTMPVSHMLEWTVISTLENRFMIMRCMSYIGITYWNERIHYLVRCLVPFTTRLSTHH